MASHKEKPLWKQQCKYTRDELFGSAEKLLASALMYFEWCDKNTWYKQEPIKSGSECGRIIDIPIRRPYSISGLCSYIKCSQGYYYRFKKTCNDEFKETIDLIEDIIETQQFEGAVTGIFNTSIIARKLGLREQTDITTNGQNATFHIEVIDNKTKQQLEELSAKLKKTS